jgi:uncharacterized repeat protein (TIGR03803 family)
MSNLSSWKTIFFLCVFCAVEAIAAPAQIFRMLGTFDDRKGERPEAGLVQATNGDGYGTTFYGGAHGYGTVFKITPSGGLRALHSFDGADGEYPGGGLVQATDGNLYGTTSCGGASGTVTSFADCFPANSGGTVFKITPGGMLTTIYSFCSQSDCTDGEGPLAGLVQGADGSFYGTTLYGGANGYGTVFKIPPGGTLTTLYSFCSQSDCPDGEFPMAGLVQGADGNFYGTTPDGGANFGGTVFKITPGGTLRTIYSFCSQMDCDDGASPDLEGLVQATDGYLYGTTRQGGAQGEGTVFKITPVGTLTTLYSFCSQSDCTDGGMPYAGLAQATDGNFYGTTTQGGAHSVGTIFKITPGGTLTTLYSFCSQSGCRDGYEPFAGLVQDTNGNLYGTTAFGGVNGYGTVFGLRVGLGPFVETRPTSGAVGAIVVILGNNLTGATSVTFNGRAATFEVVSSSEILTTVPTGATTGAVEVRTLRGTLLSNAPFQVQ